MSLAPDPLTQKMKALWEKWPETKDTVPYFGFGDYVRAEFGFTYTEDMKVRQLGVERQIKVQEIHDKEKFTWFMLQC